MTDNTSKTTDTSLEAETGLKTLSPPASPVVEKKPEPKGKAIKFTDLSNLKEGETASTFRLGKDWPERVKTGDAIKLIDANDNSDLGEAEVTAVYGGTWADVKALSMDNHIFANRANPVSGVGAQETLHQTLVQLYPDADVDKDPITVVYFKRTK